jgi:ribose transport system permease protein
MNIKSAKIYRYLKILAIIVVFVLIGVLVPGFLNPVNLLNVVRQSSIVGICAMAVAMVIIIRGIDLSTGGIISLCGLMNGVLLLGGVSLPIALIATLATGCFLGFMDGFIIAKLRVPAFIGTYVFGQVAQSLALLMKEGRSIGNFPSAYVFIGNGKILGIPFPDIIMVVFFIILTLLLSKTAFGNHVYALGHSDAVVREEGVNIDKIKIIVFSISGFCAAISGIILSAQMNTAHPTQGEQYLLDSIAACIIGGVSLEGGEGKIIHAFVGALLIGAIRNILNLLGLHPFIQNLLIGGVIITLVGINIFNKIRAERKSNSLFSVE